MAPRAQVRVVVVDDSQICREALKAALAGDPDIAIVGEGKTGNDAVSLVGSLQPSIVTLDLQMPELDGLQAIEKIMALRPTPILVITDEPNYQGVDATFEALSRGALELIPKPELWPAGGQGDKGSTLARQIKLLSRVPIIAPRRRRPARPAEPSGLVSGSASVIAIGASTGGPTAVADVLRGLGPQSRSPVLVVQHIDPAFAQSFAVWLAKQSGCKVRLAEHGDAVVPGEVLVGPPGREMGVGTDHRVVLSPAPPSALHVPSVDHLFRSVAATWGRAAVGVLLTGMGEDGARGLLTLRDRGATTIVQDKESSVVFGMPGAALELGAAQHVLPLADIAAALKKATAQS